MNTRISSFNTDKNAYRVYKADFRSLTELEIYLLSNPKINAEVFPMQKSTSLPRDFAGVPLEEAINYCHGGYTEGLPLFLALKKELENTDRSNVNVRRSVPAVVGSRPHVPNFVAGTPKTMWRLDKAESKAFVDLYINLVYSGTTTEAQIRNRGILTLNLINLFEQNNMAVNLNVFEASMLKNEIFFANIQLKQPGQVLNVGKCYYPLCGKEFVRRLMLRVKESMPFKQNWSLGYGVGLPPALLRDMLKISDSKILIGSPIEMGLKGQDIFEDADIFFDHLKLSDNILVRKKSRKRRGA